MTDKDLVVMVPVGLRDKASRMLHAEEFPSLAAQLRELPAVPRPVLLDRETRNDMVQYCENQGPEWDDWRMILLGLTVSDPEPERISVQSGAEMLRERGWRDAGSIWLADGRTEWVFTRGDRACFLLGDGWTPIGDIVGTRHVPPDEFPELAALNQEMTP